MAKYLPSRESGEVNIPKATHRLFTEILRVYILINIISRPYCKLRILVFFFHRFMAQARRQQKMLKDIVNIQVLKVDRRLKTLLQLFSEVKRFRVPK